MDQNTKIVKLPPPKKLNSHHWTNEEIVFKKKNRILTDIEHLDITLQSVLLYKLSKSVFGTFLKELNSKQYQDYIINENNLQILYWDMKRYTPHDMIIARKNNDFLKDYFDLLQKAVNDCNVIDLNFLRKYLKSLYLDSCFIKTIDNSLQDFENITILTLCANFIQDICGILLPRSLVVLELFDNLISDLTNLSLHAPTSIRYLGLARNRFTDDSHLHLLAENQNFNLLNCIDLSDNDICQLTPALKGLEVLSFLLSLSLEGNPCATTPEYKNEILQSFPKLKLLDATKILSDDRENIGNLDSDRSLRKICPGVTFQCYRILGLPEPPKDNKNIQTIHLEVNFPLLIEHPIEDEEEPIEIDDEVSPPVEDGNDDDDSKNSQEKIKKLKNKKDKTNNKKGEKKKNEDKDKKKKKSYFAGNTEYNEEFEKNNVWLKTERMLWSKIIQFPPIQINCSEKNTTAIRDTFRSIVPVRLIYLKVAPVSTKPKKEKIKMKPSKSDKKTNAHSTDDENAASSETQELLEKKSAEIVLKRLTLASFYCELKSINWSDETLDFYWADHPDVGEQALRINGSLKALEYNLNATSAKQENTLKFTGETEQQVPRIEPLPSVLTCQVGFGLNRY